MADTVSVIMPTTARTDRADCLRRAVDSVLEQRGVRAVPLLVVNGAARDAALVEELSRRPGVRLTSLDQADLPTALRVGRQQADTPWFAELDDDDLLLPDALADRLEVLQDKPECAAVITNGIVRGPSGDELHLGDCATISADPLRALIRGTWLRPGSALFRTDAVADALFLGMPRHLEWTYLATRLATSCKLHFLDRPTYVYHADTPVSASKSPDYVLGQADAIERLLELDLPADVRACFESRLAVACHGAAALLLSEGRPDDAWQWHSRSISQRGGWRYLPFSWRLLHARWRGVGGGE